MTTIDIVNGASISCAGGTLDFKSDGTVTLSTAGFAAATVRSTDLALDGCVECWCDGDRGFFIGVKGTSLWFVKPSHGGLAKAGELDRLNLQDAYDPGGLHQVTFLELDSGALLLVHELGLARLALSGEVVWQRTHDHLTARVVQLDARAVWFRDEDGRFGFDLATGDALVPDDY